MTIEATTALKRSESQRLAAKANNLLQPGRNAKTVALLAIRSVNTQYSPQGDGALASAAVLSFSAQWFVGHTDSLSSVAVSPENSRVLTGSSAHTAKPIFVRMPP